jgi:CDP-diacylglycerol---glycerol-3-phosphate 3-phosphatidyltransferase
MRGMLSVYQLKPAFQALLRPGVGWLARAGVTANQVTVLACGLSVGWGALLAWSLGTGQWVQPVLLSLPALLLLRMALNAIDGMLAREHNMQTRLGAFLNELTDVVADAALILPFMSIAQPLAVAIFAVLAALTELAGVVSQATSGVRRYDGPMGKSDRALALALFAVAYALGWMPENALSMGFLVLCALCAWTIANRVRAALRA